MGDGSKYTILVSSNPSEDPNPPEKGTKPEHWVNDNGSAFKNPWKSWRSHTFLERIGLLTKFPSFPAHPNNPTKIIPLRKPTWGHQTEPGSDASDKIKTTWLGHACFLVEFPSRTIDTSSEKSRGIRILFDPVFSDRCSPSQWIGPKRFTPPPCKIEDLPELDAVVISHNHYDHLDTHTIHTLLHRSPTRTPHFFAPLGNRAFFESIGVPATHTHIMDWWESKRIVVNKSNGSSEVVSEATTLRKVDITCTPGQHFTGRTLYDSFKTLWSSWAVVEVPNGGVSEIEAPQLADSTRPAVKLFFAGDTGYRAVLDGQDEDSVPVCPAFKTVGDKFGGFDCALIPIGAYMPRQFMSAIHCAPQDSVRLFKDIKAKKALGMHWATWILTTENVFEPPKRLAEECRKIGIADGDFTVCDIGETRFF